ncbi:putative plastid-lipid-associated protein 10, chloroplastic [Sesamum alatum]|uniref:Plastid-lipid-associated protein 10, chloroplastic n=1 Tax=Sesamum alatum TaxID=300844 RepID=A0AAE1Y1P3_9LAMI|nr:putative plastid-lipid-associated protein 10, chloroplastic [Sesamum alatum]
MRESNQGGVFALGREQHAGWTPARRLKGQTFPKHRLLQWKPHQSLLTLDNPIFSTARFFQKHTSSDSSTKTQIVFHSPLRLAGRRLLSLPIATKAAQGCTDTQRGPNRLTPDQRSSIEEALATGFVGPRTWRLPVYVGPDVLNSAPVCCTLPLSSLSPDKCVVRNVVKWSIPRLLEEQEGATLLVSAKFSVVSIRNIYLEFEEIALQNINISEELQALLAPAILPRSFLSLQILQFIKSFKAQVPVSSSQRRSVGGLYYLSYLDRNMLLGRAVGGGGVFIFTRAHAFI